jgi:hypothetical protein
MRRNTLVGKTGAEGCTSLNGLLEQVVDAVSAQSRATGIREGHRGTIPRVGVQFGKPGLQGATGRGPQRYRSLLAALALKLHEALGSKLNLGSLQPRHLRDPSSGVIERQQQGVIASARPLAQVLAVKQGVHLRPGQVTDQPFIGPFDRDGQHARGDAHAGRIADRHHPKE